MAMVAYDMDAVTYWGDIQIFSNGNKDNKVDSSSGNSSKDNTNHAGGNSNQGINGNSGNSGGNDNAGSNGNNGCGNGNINGEGNDKNQTDSIKGNDGASQLPDIVAVKPQYLQTPQSRVGYTYDAVGNRLTMEDDNGTTYYKYNEANQLVSAGDAEYEYDLNGNLVKEQNGADIKEYKYDVRNQLSEVAYHDGTYVKYGYDAAGRRVYREEASVDLSKLNVKDKTNNGKGNSNKDNTNNGKGNDKSSESNGNGNGKYNNPGQGNKYGIYKNDPQKLPLKIESTRYTYEGLTTTLSKEYSDKGSPYAEYYNANSQVISKKMFGLHGMITPGQEKELNTNGGLMYYQYNGSNTVSEITNRHGDKIEHYRYDAFGNILTGISAPYNSTTYTGQQYDDKAGLLYMNARWYNPGIGRFLTEDTYPGSSLNPQSQNRYSYVMNNPVNMWDPTGHIPSWVGKGSHYTYITTFDNKKYLDEIYSLVNHYTNSTGYSLISEVKTAKEITDTYRAHVSETWEYYHSKENYEIVEDMETGETEYIHKGTTEDLVSFSESYYSTKTIVKKAEEIAAANKQKIINHGSAPDDSPGMSRSNRTAIQYKETIISTTVTKGKVTEKVTTTPLTSQLMAKLNKQGKDIETKINAIRSKFGIPQTGKMNGIVAEQLFNLGNSRPSTNTYDVLMLPDTPTPLVVKNMSEVSEKTGSNGGSVSKNPSDNVNPTGKGPGALFRTVEDAAYDFGLTYNEKSIADHQEYGSSIYIEKVVEIMDHNLETGIDFKNEVAYYSYTKPNIGHGGDSVFPSITLKRYIVSNVHTHGNYIPKFDLGNDMFSSTKFGDTWWADISNTTIFMVNPKGELRIYRPGSKQKKGEVIRSGLPHDPFHPDWKKKDLIHQTLQGI